MVVTPVTVALCEDAPSPVPNPGPAAGLPLFVAMGLTVSTAILIAALAWFRPWRPPPDAGKLPVRRR
jgi:hypothetical protein